MKKGFTLIELLIVMVIVATMVAVALPKYRVAMERSRALEGVSNVKTAGDYVNARYVINGNTYSTVMNADLIPSNYFTTPTVSISGTTATISSTRTSPSSFNYTITGTAKYGTSLELACTGDTRICDGLSL